jgi:hypothetical protein
MQTLPRCIIHVSAHRAMRIRCWARPRTHDDNQKRRNHHHHDRAEPACTQPRRTKSSVRTSIWQHTILTQSSSQSTTSLRRDAAPLQRVCQSECGSRNASETRGRAIRSQLQPPLGAEDAGGFAGSPCRWLRVSDASACVALERVLGSAVPLFAARGSPRATLQPFSGLMIARLKRNSLPVSRRRESRVPCCFVDGLRETIRVPAVSGRECTSIGCAA